MANAELLPYCRYQEKEHGISQVQIAACIVMIMNDVSPASSASAPTEPLRRDGYARGSEVGPVFRFLASPSNRRASSCYYLAATTYSTMSNKRNPALWELKLRSPRSSTLLMMCSSCNVFLLQLVFALGNIPGAPGSSEHCFLLSHSIQHRLVNVQLQPEHTGYKLATAHAGTIVSGVSVGVGCDLPYTRHDVLTNMTQANTGKRYPARHRSACPAAGNKDRVG